MIDLEEDLDKSDKTCLLNFSHHSRLECLCLRCSSMHPASAAPSRSMSASSLSSSSSSSCSPPMNSRNHSSNPVVLHIDNSDDASFAGIRKHRSNSNHKLVSSHPQINSHHFSQTRDTLSRCERRVEFCEFNLAVEQAHRKPSSQLDNKHGTGSEANKEIPSKRSSSGSPSLRDCKRSRAAPRNSQDRRMSLLGKPVYIRPHKQSSPFLKSTQNEIHNFLERPRGWKAMTYHVIMFFMIFACLVLTVFSTIEQYEDEASSILLKMEIIMVVWFAFEFIIRTWASGCRSRYQGWMGRFRYIRSPFCAIDFVVIIASIIVLSIGSSGQMFAASALRGLRFFQILRMVRMDRRGGTWKLLGSVVYAHRQELITTVYIGFLGLIFSSFLVFLFEKGVNPNKFNNFADALWWGMITMCTVGYGDIVPETWPGKIVASFCSLLGISFFALPAGILGSGFALKVQQLQRQKHMIRRRVPAATLIGCLWRCYAADENSLSSATWRIYQAPLPSPPEFKPNTSFVSRLSSIRRTKPRAREDSIIDTRDTNRVRGSISQESITKDILDSAKQIFEDEDLEESQFTVLTKQHKNAIRSLRKIKYFVARRKFKEALKPYDVKDVIEQYSAGHVDLLSRVKNIQSRLDSVFGKTSSKTGEVHESSISLATRIVKMERIIENIDTKLENFLKKMDAERGAVAKKVESGAVPVRTLRAEVARPSTVPSYPSYNRFVPNHQLKLWFAASSVSLKYPTVSNIPHSISLPSTSVGLKQSCKHSRSTTPALPPT